VDLKFYEPVMEVVRGTSGSDEGKIYTLRIFEGCAVETRPIPVRLSKEMLESIDLLVRLKIFNSRSEALRKLLQIGLKEVEKHVRILRAIEELFDIEKKTGKIPIRLAGERAQLLKERDRL